MAGFEANAAAAVAANNAFIPLLFYVSGNRFRR
jgi:hypothetical protein